MRSVLACGLLALILAIGACTTADDCGPFPGKFYTTDFSSEAVKATVPDTNRVKPTLSPIDGDTLTDGHFAIRMLPQTTTYSLRPKRERSFRLFNTAYACSPDIPTSDEVIQDIRISTDPPFGSDGSSSDDVSSLFDIIVLTRDGYREYELDGFLSRAPNAVRELILILDATPETTSRFQFTVEYVQDGRGLEYYEFQTNPIVLPSG